MSNEISAYEKMLRDGTAFKKIDMNQIAAQQYKEADVSVATGGREVSTPIGEPTNESSNSMLEEDHTDWTELDNAMEKRMMALREKMSGKKSTKKPLNESNEILKLKKRVQKLEEAMMLIMETHEKLLGD